jgi:imidazole glycerol-phosphate synthase subunit HisH
MVTVIDYGVGNLGSIQNMFKRLGVECTTTSDIKKIKDASKILLPGVGAFDAALKKLESTDLTGVLVRKAKSGIPFLGICLGAQLLTKSSEEGVCSGLGLLNAECTKFEIDNQLWKVPHMGWSEVIIIRNHPVLDFSTLPDERPRFYFAHSYHFKTEDKSIEAGQTEYGYSFPSILASDNILAVQFHPEKSHKFGMKLLENFSKWEI